MHLKINKEIEEMIASHGISDEQKKKLMILYDIAGINTLVAHLVNKAIDFGIDLKQLGFSNNIIEKVPSKNIPLIPLFNFNTEITDILKSCEDNDDYENILLEYLKLVG